MLLKASAVLMILLFFCFFSCAPDNAIDKGTNCDNVECPDFAQKILAKSAQGKCSSENVFLDIFGSVQGACKGSGECQIACIYPECPEGKSMSITSDSYECYVDDPCNGVDCLGHGRCRNNNGQAQCDCNDGYFADGIECIKDTNSSDGDIELDIDQDLLPEVDQEVEQTEQDAENNYAEEEDIEKDINEEAIESEIETETEKELLTRIRIECEDSGRIQMAWQKPSDNEVQTRNVYEGGVDIDVYSGEESSVFAALRWDDNLPGPLCSLTTEPDTTLYVYAGWEHRTDFSQLPPNPLEYCECTVWGDPYLEITVDILFLLALPR